MNDEALDLLREVAEWFATGRGPQRAAREAAKAYLSKIEEYTEETKPYKPEPPPGNSTIPIQLHLDVVKHLRAGIDEIATEMELDAEGMRPNATIRQSVFSHSLAYRVNQLRDLLAGR